MSYMASLFAAAAVFACGAALLALYTGVKNRNRTGTAAKLRLAASAIMAAGACFGLILAVIGFIAGAHGAENRAFLESSAAKLMEMNRLSHTVERKKEPEPNQLFAYVRYGCKDCMAVSEDLTEAVNVSGLPFAGWYSTRTDIGKNLLEKYPVQAVPMLVWLDSDGWPTTCDPALPADDGSVSFDKAAVDAFFEEIKAARAETAIAAANRLTDLADNNTSSQPKIAL